MCSWGYLPREEVPDFVQVCTKRLGDLRDLHVEFLCGADSRMNRVAQVCAVHCMCGELVFCGNVKRGKHVVFHVVVGRRGPIFFTREGFFMLRSAPTLQSTILRKRENPQDTGKIAPLCKGVVLSGTPCQIGQGSFTLTRGTQVEGKLF